MLKKDISSYDNQRLFELVYKLDDELSQKRAYLKTARKRLNLARKRISKMKETVAQQRNTIMELRGLKVK